MHGIPRLSAVREHTLFYEFHEVLSQHLLCDDYATKIAKVRKSRIPHLLSETQFEHVRRLINEVLFRIFDTFQIH